MRTTVMSLEAPGACVRAAGRLDVLGSCGDDSLRGSRWPGPESGWREDEGRCVTK
jgi:hypothetical protein